MKKANMKQFRLEKKEFWGKTPSYYIKKGNVKLPKIKVHFGLVHLT